MGKPFSKELELINDTIDWSSKVDVSEFSILLEKYNCPIYIVGSGGSLSACYYAASLASSNGKFAQAITPLELINVRKTINKSLVIFISASGKNNDILFAFKTAIQEEPFAIACICMVEESPLSKLAQQYTLCEAYQYLLPSGKDGFLATNSLIAFYIILNRAFHNYNILFKNQIDSQLLKREIETFVNLINPEYSFLVLYSGWGSSIGIDLESKCTEAALGKVSLSDYRNFGHGRHHWLAKRGKNSAIIAIITPYDEELAKKTLKELPDKIPILTLKSDLNNSMSSIELLIKSFFFVKTLGDIQNIDPGRPGVPEFGRKLYNLHYQKELLKNKDFGISIRCSLAIRRKLRINSLDVLEEKQLLIWQKKYISYINCLNSQPYGSIVFDYDGTLCSSKERFLGLSSRISSELLKILSYGFIIGVVTGRGISVKDALQKALPDQKYWPNIIIGYYNGSQIGTLENNLLPDVSGENFESLVKIQQILDTIENPFDLKYTLRPNQLTIENMDKRNWKIVKLYIIQRIKTAQINDVQILESSHSMDIIQNSTSKTNIFHFCGLKAKELGKPITCLSIGDKGQWPGNDFDLLDNAQALSVEESSPNPNSGWNLASLGLKNVDATIEYLRCLKFENNKMKINLTK